MDAPLLHAREITCSRSASDNSTVFLSSASFSCLPSTLNLLWGSERSGTGLFLRILGLLESPDSGEVFLRNFPTSHLSPSERADLRSHRFGYLFPEPFLLPSLSVFENVAMPLFKISGANIEDARQRTRASLEFVGLADSGEPVAGELPLFDQHRVALARALVNEPECLILENLDLPELELLEFVKLVRAASEQFGIAAIFSAPDDRIVHLMDRSLEMGTLCEKPT